MLWTEGPGDWWAWGSGLIWKELLLLPFTSWRPGSYLRQKREEARWSKTTWGGTAGGTVAQTWPQGKRSALLQLLPVKFINLCLSQGDGCGQGTRADGPGRAQLIFRLDTWGHSSTSLLTTSPDNEWKAATCHTTCSSITWQGSHAGPTLLTSCLAAQEARCILLLLLQLVQPHPAACHIHTVHCRASLPASSSSAEYMRSFPGREYTQRGGGPQMSPPWKCPAGLSILPSWEGSLSFGLDGTLRASGGGDWDQTQKGGLGHAYAPSSHFRTPIQSYICTERGDMSVIPWTIRTWRKANPEPQWVHISYCRRLWRGTLYYRSLCAIPLGVSSLLCSVSNCNDFFPKYRTDKIRWHSRARLNSSAFLDVPK